MRRQDICVDFDGVINSYESGFTKIDDLPDAPVKGAFKWLLSMNASGYDVNILSTRSSDRRGLAAMKAWFIEHGWRMNTDGEPEYLLFPTKKPPALIYIDDRGYCFDGTFPTAHFIRTFKPWNKR